MISSIQIRVLYLAFFILGCASVIFSQKPGEKPDFSGTWTLTKNEEKSTSPFIDAIIKVSPDICNAELTIEQEEQTLRISRKGSCTNKKGLKPNSSWQYSVVYYIDGRGEKSSVVASVTKWKNKSIIIKQYEIRTEPGKEKKAKEPFQTIELKLRDGGKTLIEIFKHTNNDNFKPVTTETRYEYTRENK
jgi:hypothetical protein